MSWIAVRGVDRPSLLERLGAEDTGLASEPWDAGVHLAAGDDWLIVGARDTGFATPERLAALSGGGGEAVSCWVEEHVMASEAFGYSGGSKLWGVLYDCGERLGDVRVLGEPPPQFAAIRAEALARQAAEDPTVTSVDFIFDIPATLVSALCGYDPHEDPAPVFTKLRLHESARKPVSGGLLAALFGGRKR